MTVEDTPLPKAVGRRRVQAKSSGQEAQNMKTRIRTEQSTGYQSKNHREQAAHSKHQETQL